MTPPHPDAPWPARARAAAQTLRILFVTPECAPWAKTGGLGDVGAALPRALAALGHEVRVLMPAYSGIRERAAGSLAVTALPAAGNWPAATLVELAAEGFELWLLDCPGLYDRPGGGPYVDEHGRDHADNAVRFGFLAWTAALLSRAQSPWPHWQPDVLHANDWPTGLAPAYLGRTRPRAASVFTIHNLAFQGLFPAESAGALALPPEWLDVDGVLHWDQISMLKAGVRYADAITTVSPTYAREIQHEPLGCGMEGMMRLRADVLHGILNGIDADEWNPRTDRHIAQPYGVGEWAAKHANKSALQARLGLQRVDDLLFGVVSRLTAQKGIDLIVDSIDRLVADGAQLAVLGTGDAALERRLVATAAAHPGRVAVHIGFDEGLAHLIEAGADAFLMPSRFEPCGLNQMYSLVYGTPPLVHATGGLADTVRDAVADPQGTGFVMPEASVGALQRGLEQVRRAFDDKEGWRRLQSRGMAKDFGWQESAAAYERLYRACLARQESD